MNSRRSRSFFLGALGAVGVPIGGPFSSKAQAADSFVLRLHVPEAATSTFGTVAVHYAVLVERRTQGRLKIEVYPSGQLGRQDQIDDALVAGVIDLALHASAVMVPLFPQLQVLDLPFLFRDMAAAFRVLDGPIGDELFGILEARGILGLAWGASGFKELETVSKAVVVPDDMKGLRVRILSNATYLATYQALGAIPLTIDIAETFVALTQRTVEGMDINLDSFMAAKFYNACKHVAMLNHFFPANPLIGSKRKIEALPPDLQRILKQEAKALIPYWRSLAARQTADDIVFLKKNGVVFTEIQYPAFRKAVEPVYAMLQARLGGDLIDRVSRAAASGR